ncbi:PHP domain-containing protein [Candidatus Woesearchaeota archaeon]|nr:PHP domain-containing protein [Candidatus Woesearchaeota archaeon]
MRENILNSRIEIQSVDIDRIRGEGFTPVDMHVHSQYSDTHTKVRNILKKAEKLGIGVAITDHNEINGAIKAKKLAKKQQLLIPGIEVGVKESAHVLLYFYNLGELEEFYKKHILGKLSRFRYFRTKLPINELIESTENYNCIISAAHPYSMSKFGIGNVIKSGKIQGSILDSIDAIEVINGLVSKKGNLESIRLSSRLKKLFTGGSDSHVLMEVGKVLTYSESDDADSFLDSIRKKNNFVIGKRKNVLLLAAFSSKTIEKHLRSVIIKRAPVV